MIDHCFFEGSASCESHPRLLLRTYNYTSIYEYISRFVNRTTSRIWISIALNRLSPISWMKPRRSLPTTTWLCATLPRPRRERSLEENYVIDHFPRVISPPTITTSFSLFSRSRIAIEQIEGSSSSRIDCYFKCENEVASHRCGKKKNKNNSKKRGRRFSSRSVQASGLFVLCVPSLGVFAYFTIIKSTSRPRARLWISTHACNAARQERIYIHARAPPLGTSNNTAAKENTQRASSRAETLLRPLCKETKRASARGHIS